MIETGMRAGEVVVEAYTRRPDAVIRDRAMQGGGQGRPSPIGQRRAAHPVARRAPHPTCSGSHADAEVPRRHCAELTGFHPHLLRHTAASRWLAAGGSEGGLMAVAGWSTRDMIDRYTRATAAEHAAAEARGLNLGEL